MQSWQGRGNQPPGWLRPPIATRELEAAARQRDGDGPDPSGSRPPIRAARRASLRVLVVVTPASLATTTGTFPDVPLTARMGATMER